MLKANKKILATLETLWVDFSDSGMPLIINLLYVNEPRQRKLMFTSDYYITAIQLQTLLNCCTNEVSIVYFNTIKTAISIEMAPTIKIRKKLQFFFLAAIYMPGSHDGSVSVLFSPRDISLATKFVDLSRYEQPYKMTPLTL